MDLKLTKNGKEYREYEISLSKQDLGYLVDNRILSAEHEGIIFLVGNSRQSDNFQFLYGSKVLYAGLGFSTTPEELSKRIKQIKELSVKNLTGIIGKVRLSFN